MSLVLLFYLSPPLSLSTISTGGGWTDCAIYREIELSYELDRESWNHTLMLKEARKKTYQALEAKTEKELREYREEVGHVTVCESTEHT